MADISAVITTNGDTYNLKDATARESLVPSGGTTGQVLTKTASGYGWADASGGGGEEKIYLINRTSISALDKTFSEIYAAIEDGYLPVVYDNAVSSSSTKTFYLCSYATSSTIYFVRPSPNTGYTKYLRLYSTGTLSETSQYGILSKSVTLYAANWDNGTYTISSPYIFTETLISLECPTNISVSDYAILQAAKIRPVEQTTSAITLKAYGTVPTSDVTIKVTLVGTEGSF